MRVRTSRIVCGRRPRRVPKVGSVTAKSPRRAARYIPSSSSAMGAGAPRATVTRHIIRTSPRRLQSLPQHVPIRECSVAVHSRTDRMGAGEAAEGPRDVDRDAGFKPSAIRKLFEHRGVVRHGRWQKGPKIFQRLAPRAPSSTVRNSAASAGRHGTDATPCRPDVPCWCSIRSNACSLDLCDKCLAACPYGAVLAAGGGIYDRRRS